MLSPPINLRGRFVFLDGLRGLAAVSVAFFHFFNHWVSPIHDRLAAVLPGVVQRVLEHADWGVEIFFVLSGFVIAHSLYGQRITPGFAGNFALRRSLRLDPPYWVVLALSISVPYLFGATFADGIFSRFGGMRGFLINMFYLPDLMWWPRVVGVAWTLCLEVQFYLAFLILLAVIQGFAAIIPARGTKLIPAFTALVFGLLAVYSIHRWFSLGKNDFGGRWFMFFSGVFLYWTMRGRIDRRVLCVYLLIMAGLAIWFAEPRSGMILLTTGGIWIAGYAGGLQTWLSGRWVQYLGRISYSFYLVHMTVGVWAINMVLKLGGGSIFMVFVAFAGALAVAVVAGDLLYRLAELPAVRLSKRFKHPRAGDSIEPARRQDASLGNSPAELVIV